MQHDYKAISNDLQPGDSLESVHDTIHNTVGSDGHMSMLAYSSFDPIFWLHHANVDRMFAMWQALNPDSYVTKMENPYATFTYEGGFTADEKTNLTPFHRNDAGRFWTSEDIRDTNVFAYTYPELVDLGDKGKEKLTARVKALYGPDAMPQKRSMEEDGVQLTKRDSARIAGAPNFSGKRQYIANIKVHKFGLDGSFSVYVFLGDDCGNDAKAWMTESSFVGSVGMLSQAGVAAADTQKLNQVANGAVPLTAALEAKVRVGELESMHEEVVAKYLQERLGWRISKVRKNCFTLSCAYANRRALDQRRRTLSRPHTRLPDRGHVG
jgi:tyrosinase